MSDTFFTVEDNHSKLFAADEVRLAFRKDPLVGRVWIMSYTQLIDLQTAIEAYRRAK